MHAKVATKDCISQQESSRRIRQQKDLIFFFNNTFSNLNINKLKTKCFSKQHNWQKNKKTYINVWDRNLVLRSLSNNKINKSKFVSIVD